MGIEATRWQQNPERRRLRATSERAQARYRAELKRAASGIDTDERGTKLAKLAQKMMTPFQRDLTPDERVFLRDAVQLTIDSPHLKVLDTAGGFLCVLAKDLKNDFKNRDALELISKEKRPSKQEKLERDFAAMVLTLCARTSERAQGNAALYDPKLTYGLVRQLERSAVRSIAGGLDPNVGVEAHFYELAGRLRLWAERLATNGPATDIYEAGGATTRANFDNDVREIAGH